MLFRTQGAGIGSRHLLVAEPGKDSVPRLLIQSRFDHYAMRLSPDGRWLAYVSEESGIAEVYVRPFPNVDSARIAISVGGGIEPVWSRNGTELFFRGQRGEMFATPVTWGPASRMACRSCCSRFLRWGRISTIATTTRRGTASGS